MRRDDRDAAPYKPSQSVRRLLGVATEHLDAVYGLLVDAKVQHPGAPFTLLRASIETAATATWLMTPNRRVERLRRTLCRARINLYDQANVEREHLITAPRPFEERQDSIREAADRIQPGLQLSKVKSTEVLKDVEQATSPNERIGLSAAWQGVLGVRARAPVGHSGIAGSGGHGVRRRRPAAAHYRLHAGPRVGHADGGQRLHVRHRPLPARRDEPLQLSVKGSDNPPVRPRI
jgi:hypothetical protein